MESELFGHVRGAYTGAVADRDGLFVQSDGGTLFLDEVDSCPPGLQTRLLRVLETGTVKPVGSNRERRVDVRVIGAGQNVRAKIPGQFREDLFYRLARWEIELSPLRDRRADIKPLVAHFIEAGCAEFGLPIARIAKVTLDELRARDWPGNVRQLKSAVEKAVIKSRGGPLTLEHFPMRTSEPPTMSTAFATTAQAAGDAAKRAAIVSALKRTDSNKSRAAELLGYTRSHLYTLIRKYSINEDEYR